LIIWIWYIIELEDDNGVVLETDPVCISTSDFTCSNLVNEQFVVGVPTMTSVDVLNDSPLPALVDMEFSLDGVSVGFDSKIVSSARVGVMNKIITPTQAGESVPFTAIGTCNAAKTDKVFTIQELIDDGLIHWYSMNAANGVFPDSTGGFNGTYSQTAQELVPTGYSVIATPGLESLNLPSPILVRRQSGAILLTVRPNRFDLSGSYLGQNYICQNRNMTRNDIYFSAAGYFVVEGMTNNDYWTTFDDVLKAGEKYTLCISADNSVVKTYINGVFISTKNVVSDLEIWRFFNDYFIYIKSDMELFDFRIYDRPITDQEATYYDSKYRPTFGR